MKTNANAARILRRLADYMELDGENSFKVAAYRKAAQAVAQLTYPIENAKHRLESIEGIGKAIAAVLKEIIENGKPRILEELENKIPPSLPNLLRIPGLGPKSVRILYQKLGITSIDELLEAAKEGKIRGLPGFGEKTEAKLIESIHRWMTQPDQIPIAVAMPVGERLTELFSHSPHVEKASLAGSLRRMKDMVNDIDIVLATRSRSKLLKEIEQWPFIKNFTVLEDDHVHFVVEYGWELPVDVCVTSPEGYIEALIKWTGPEEYYRRVSEASEAAGPLDPADYPDEAEWLRSAGLPYFPPELREVDVALGPVLEEESDWIDIEHIRGDLHMHTQWSDGDCTIEQMVAKAREKGYEYIAITDHSRTLKIARGLSTEQLQKQHKVIEEWNSKSSDIHIFTGIEMDILNDGILDYPDEILKEVDFVIGSIHSGFRQSEEQITGRIVRAIENNHVDLIAHPTGRILGRREPYNVNFKAILEAARKTDTALEINASPNRLDLKAEHARMAVEEYGVRISINTDAHDLDEMDHMKYGIGTGRRARITKKDVINTMTLSEIKRWLKRNDA